MANPQRDISYFDNRAVYAPADGKVVVVEETEEGEYFKDKRIQVTTKTLIFFFATLMKEMSKTPWFIPQRVR